MFWLKTTEGPTKRRLEKACPRAGVARGARPHRSTAAEVQGLQRSRQRQMRRSASGGPGRGQGENTGTLAGSGRSPSRSRQPRPKSRSGARRPVFWLTWQGVVASFSVTRMARPTQVSGGVPHRETHKLKAKGFQLWLRRIYYLDQKSAPSADAVQSGNRVHRNRSRC